MKCSWIVRAASGLMCGLALGSAIADDAPSGFELLEASVTSRVLAMTQDKAKSVSFTRDGKRVLALSQSGGLALWDVRTGDRVSQFVGHSGEVHSAMSGPDGSLVVSGSDDRTARIWEAQTGILLRTLKHPQAVYLVSFSEDGKAVTTYAGDNKVRYWDVKSGALLRSLAGPTETVHRISTDRKLYLGNSGDALRLWDVRTGRLLNTIIGLPGGMFDAQLSPDNQFVLAGSGNTESLIQLWDAKTGVPIKAFRGHKWAIFAVAFSPDGKHFASGALDDTIRIWDIQSGAELAVLRGHSNAIRSLEFSLDGKTLVSGAWDKTLRLWDVSQLLGKTRKFKVTDGRRLAIKDACRATVLNIRADYDQEITKIERDEDAAIACIDQSIKADSMSRQAMEKLVQTLKDDLALRDLVLGAKSDPSLEGAIHETVLNRARDFVRADAPRVAYRGGMVTYTGGKVAYDYVLGEENFSAQSLECELKFPTVARPLWNDYKFEHIPLSCITTEKVGGKGAVDDVKPPTDTKPRSRVISL